MRAFLQLSLNADPDAEEGSCQSYCEEIIRDYLDVRSRGSLLINGVSK